MIIDIAFVILLVFGIFTGLRKGLIIALFSVIGFIIGLAAALKLSSYVAVRLSEGLNTNTKWLPVISFLLVFVAVMILVQLGARLLQKSVEMVMLGWLNRLGGVIIYCLLYSIVLSIFLFYAIMMQLIRPETLAESMTYPYIKDLGPKVINSLGVVIPWFKDMFSQLEAFFGGLKPAAS